MNLCSFTNFVELNLQTFFMVFGRHIRQCDDVWAHWRTLFKDVLDQHVPLKKKWIRGDQLPWISPDLLREILHRNKLFKRHKRNCTSTSWDDFKRQGYVAKAQHFEKVLL